MNPNRPTCSLIIPTRNRCEILDHTLDKINALTDRHFETLVVDNASTDDTPKLKECFPNVHWIEPGHNLGSAARNLAAAAARGRILLMLDDDSWPEDGTIEKIVTLFDRRPDLGAVACRVLLADPPDRHDAGGVPGIFFNCGGAIRRIAFIEAGGFPIDFDYYVEEYALACRLWQKGWRVEPRGDLRIRHRRTRANRDNDRMLRCLVRNNLVVWQRYAPDDRLEDLIASTIERYARVAAKEDARRGFQEGLREGSARIAGGLIRRTPLTADQFDELFGLPAATRAVRRWTDKYNIRSVSIWSRGKGCELLVDLLISVGISIHVVYDHADAIGADTEWRRVPLQCEERFTPDQSDGLVVGSLSPGVAEDTRRALANRFPGIPILSAAPWMEESTARLAISA
ncbi:MAG: glycosyltransferase family 2 protein [Phycisphaerae bacterium]